MIVSIVTPSLNGRRYLAECIDSVYRQQSRRVQVEHIVVDGGSTDGTPEYARSRGCTVLTRAAVSPYAALNKGSLHASGQLIGTIGCDDVFLPGALDEVVRSYEKARTRWLFGGYRWLTQRGYRGVMIPPRRIPPGVFSSHHWSAIPHGAVFFQRDLFIELGGYDPSFMVLGDFEFLVRLLYRREPCVRIARPLYAWRLHDSNVSQHDPVISDEIAKIHRRHGPPRSWERAVYRNALRVVLNVRNPSWYALKRFDACRCWLQSPSPS